MPDVTKSLKEFAVKLKNPAWLCFVWFGMSAGISLLETPVKFTAPTITREIALDVGRVVFAALNQAEIIALILLLILLRISGHARDLLAPCLCVALIQIAQASWLLPVLSERAQQVVEGVEPGPSAVHGTYAVLQLLKLALLLYTGFRSMSSGTMVPEAKRSS